MKRDMPPGGHDGHAGKEVQAEIDFYLEERAREFEASGMSMGGAQGQASDIDIQAKEILRVREVLNEILAKNTGQDVERIEQDTDRDYIMTAAQSRDYGLIDEVITKRA